MADGQRAASSKARPSWRPLGVGEMVYVLNDLVEQPDASPETSDVTNKRAVEIISETAARFMREHAPEIVEKIISEAVHKIVRDLAPAIVERVIREEIEKLKRESS